MKRLLMLICLTGAALLCVHSGNVPLQGDLQGGGLKSPGDPVEVFQTTGSIEVNFLCNLGKLNIAVTNQNGNVVFNQGIDATAGSSLPINTGGWAADEYTLLISDGQGGSLVGIFEIIYQLTF